MNNTHVLLLEDDPLWVETVREVIAPHVSRFEAVATLADAENLVNAHFFTVAIIDVSLAEGDPKDSDGMQFLRVLAECNLGEVVSTIILSAYGNMERQRAAFRDFHVVDFLSKADFRPDELLSVVQKASEEKKRLDPLVLELESGRPLATLWNQFEWPKREDPKELAFELTDLLRRLFPGATELFLQPIRSGQSGAGVVKAEPIYGAKRGAPLIVKFGKRGNIETERRNYDDHIERFVSHQASTQLGYVAGRVMGAIGYSLVGAELGEVMALADYYAAASTEEMQRTLDNLIQRTCGRWYENREQPRRTRNLVDLYQRGLHIRSWDRIWQGMAQVCPDIGAPRLSFSGIDGEFHNPKLWLETRQYEIYLPIWMATTHGDLNEHNVLVTDDSRTWLIDFYRTGPGHILRDVVELECAIKFSLSGILDLASYRRFEATLLGQQRLDKAVSIPSTAPFAKPLEVITYLRGLIADFAGPGMREYQAALLLHTLYLLSLDFLYRPEGNSRAPVLLSAAMLLDCL